MMNAPLYLPQYHFNSGLADDFCALLEHKQVAHMGKWKYSTTNFMSNNHVAPRDFWQEFTHSQDYYISDAERELIRSVLPNVVSKLKTPITKFIDFGPGASDAVQSKTVPFLHAIKSINKYIPIDVEQDFLDQARDVVEHTGLKIDIQQINEDFYKPIGFNEPRDQGYYLAAMFGCTISNIEQAPFLPFPRAHLIKQLQGLREFLDVGDTFILTVDSNQNQDSLVKAYTSQSEMYANLLWRIKREVNPTGNFDPNNFEFKPVWFADSHALTHSITAKKDCTFRIYNNEYSLFAGQTFYFHNCYKIPSHLMISIGEQAGFDHLAVYTDNKSRLCLHVFQVK